MSANDRATLSRELEEIFAHPLRPLGPERFRELALRAFSLQYQGSPVYAAFCRGRGATPASVDSWEEIPAVPAAAFKHMDLGSAPGSPEAVFVTSGTTRGGEERGRHPVASLGLYRRAAIPWFGVNLVPEGGRIPILSLVPDPAEAPGSSLSAMMGFAVEAFGAPGSGFFAHPETGVDAEAFHAALRAAVEARRPVLVMGTAFAWVHWLEAAAREGWRLSLPEGSRLMETGGFKGRSRAVPRDELYAELQVRLGVASARMVNEYGMTELLSQLYEPVLRTGFQGGPADRTHTAPPWLGVRALDPETLAPLAPGEVGVLAFLDLANLGSVSAILTEDLGSVEGDAVRLAGRASGAEPRGCSLALEEFLEGAR